MLCPVLTMKPYNDSLIMRWKTSLLVSMNMRSVASCCQRKIWRKKCFPVYVKKLRHLWLMIAYLWRVVLPGSPVRESDLEWRGRLLYSGGAGAGRLAATSGAVDGDTEEARKGRRVSLSLIYPPTLNTQLLYHKNFQNMPRIRNLLKLNWKNCKLLHI